jgi:enamine deaminase RidA (YjgF/YER057c/UK114 family)
LTSIQKRVTVGSSVTTVSRDSIREHFVTIVPQGKEGPESLFKRVGDTLRRLDGRIVSAEAIGLAPADRQWMPILTAALGGASAPLAWIEDARTDNLYGVHVWAVSGTVAQALPYEGRRAGTLFEDGFCQYCRLVGLLPIDPKIGHPAQTQSIFDQMEAVLHSGGMAFSDVLRTWFYNDDILAWYRDFNVVRTKFFNEKMVFDGLLPASTGVAGRNAIGGALLSGLIAVRSEDEGVKAFEVSSPLQSSATNYGSSFSRAVELELPDLRRLYISGTASIDEQGKTIFLGDCAGQVRQTMEIVQAILQSREMDWGDVTRSLVYFKRAADAPLFEKYRQETGVPAFPAVTVENDICRDDLLFEIEVDAVAAK